MSSDVVGIAAVVTALVVGLVGAGSALLGVALQHHLERGRAAAEHARTVALDERQRQRELFVSVLRELSVVRNLTQARVIAWYNDRGPDLAERHRDRLLLARERLVELEPAAALWLPAEVSAALDDVAYSHALEDHLDDLEEREAIHATARDSYTRVLACGHRHFPELAALAARQATPHRTTAAPAQAS